MAQSLKSCATRSTTLSFSHGNESNQFEAEIAQQLPPHDDEGAKLDLQNVPFCGRQEELKQIKDAYHSAVAAQPHAERPSSAKIPGVFLRGLSGTGKSHLVYQFVNDLETEQGKASHYFIEGKNDESTGANDPFSSIIQALNSLCQQIKNGPSDERKRLAQNIQRAMGGETRSIVKLVPAMWDVLHPDGAASIISDARSSVASNSLHRQSQFGSSTDTVWKQLQYSFVCFIKAIATKQRPVIMFLDDLQWSSQVSMDLMTTVLSDNELRHFLFIGAIRHEPNPHADEIMELDPQLPVSKLFQALGKFDDEEHITGAETKWTNITLTNMAEADLAVLLSKLMQRPSEELEDLTAKVYQSTRGNIFFTLQLIKQLQRSDVIVFDQARCQWEYNWRHKMEARSKSSQRSFTFAGDVVQLITTRIQELPAELQTALAVASYIRFTFDLEVLRDVLKELSERPMDGLHFLNDEAGNITLAHLLEQAVLEGLLSNTIGGTTYRFAHDRIQQAACAIIPPGEQRDKLRQRIGKSLLSMYRRHAEKGDTSSSPEHQEPQVDQSLLFVATDLMNSVPTKDHLFSLQLNMEVGEKSANMAALAAAARYYEQASIALTKIRNPWKDHYDLTLQLHQNRAEVQISLSNYDLGHAVGQAVLHNSHSADDKIPVYLALTESLGRQNRLLDSLHLAKKAAQMLGEYPKRGLLGHVIKDTIWVTRYLRKTPDEKILSVPFMTDPRKLMASRLLGQMILRSMNIKEYLDMFVTILKLIRLSVRHGLNRDTGLAFGLFSLLTGSQNDQTNALRYARLGGIIAERTGGHEMEACVRSLCGVFVLSWSESAVDVVQGYNRGHIVAMGHGHLEVGLYCWYCGTVLAFWDGYRLSDIHRSYQVFFEHMKLYNVTTNILMIRQHQHIVALTIGAVPLEWAEIESFDGRSDSLSPPTDQENYYPRLVGYWNRIFLSAIFFKYEMAEMFVKKLFKLGNDTSYILSTTVPMYAGIMAAGRYRQTKKRKYLQQLRKLEQESSKLWKRRGKNSMNRALIVRAELKSVTMRESQWELVQSAYDVAIVVSVQAASPFPSFGHINEAALASELCGEFLLRVGQHNEAVPYFTTALEYYHKWGAKIKVEDLMQNRSQHINPVQLAAIKSKNQKQSEEIAAADGTMRFEFSAQADRDERMTYSLLYGSNASKDNEILLGKTFTATDEPSCDTLQSLDRSGQAKDDDNVSVLSDAS